MVLCQITAGISTICADTQTVIAATITGSKTRRHANPCILAMVMTMFIITRARLQRIRNTSIASAIIPALQSLQNADAATIIISMA